MPRRRSCGSSAATSSASSCLLRPRGGRRHCPLSSVLECVVMSVRLDHGEDTLDEMDEINVTPFIDAMLVLLAYHLHGGRAARYRRHSSEPAGIDRRRAAAAG